MMKESHERLRLRSTTATYRLGKPVAATNWIGRVEGKCAVSSGMTRTSPRIQTFIFCSRSRKYNSPAMLQLARHAAPNLEIQKPKFKKFVSKSEHPA